LIYFVQNGFKLKIIIKLEGELIRLVVGAHA
jgi:hypothetical protein